MRVRIGPVPREHRALPRRDARRRSAASRRQADRPEACSSICAVLAETDVINMVSRGITIPNILRGIHQSMAGRYLRLVVSAGINGVVLVTGGLAADEGLLAALQGRRGRTEDGVRHSEPFRVDPRGRVGRGALGCVSRTQDRPPQWRRAGGGMTSALSNRWSLDGRVALVAGAAGDIGGAIAVRLAGAGARVIGVDRPDRAAPQGIETIACDLTQPEEVSKLIQTVVARHGHLDLVAHAAGITRDASLSRLSDDDWRSVMAVNVDSAFLSAARGGAGPPRDGRRIGRARLVDQRRARQSRSGELRGQQGRAQRARAHGRARMGTPSRARQRRRAGLDRDRR